MPASSSFCRTWLNQKTMARWVLLCFVIFIFGLRRRCAGCVSAQKAVMTWATPTPMLLKVLHGEQLCGLQFPWPVDETPAFLQLKGFDVKMLAIDMLHCWHLGIGRDLVGSAVKTLVRLRDWPGTSIEKSLGRATLCLRRWAKQHGLTLACRSLSKSSIGWDQDYPELRAKGYDCYVILKWLAEETSSNPPVGTNAVEQDYLDRISATIWCANSWLSSLSNAGMFLTEHQQELKTVIGAHYVSLYVGLAAQALAEKKKCGESDQNCTSSTTG